MEQATKKEPLLSVKETCEVLKISRPTFYRLAKAGRLRVVRIGPHYKCAPRHIDEFIERNETPPIRTNE